MSDASVCACTLQHTLTYTHTRMLKQYRDLPHDSQLSLVVWEVSECAQALVGSTVIPLFNRKGRLKTGPQRLKVGTKRDAFQSGF
jgi:hypothetical protein